MTPVQLNNLLTEIKNNISAIKKTYAVVDDSQLVNYLQELYSSDNQILLGVFPDFGFTGNVSGYRKTSVQMMMILEKADYSTLTYEEYIALFERTYQTAEAIVRFLINKSEMGCSSLLEHIDVGGITIEPIWKKADCNGWSINFETR